jgi:phospholipid/cholesterol/gamma-HCH transport system ATP-binding protein
VAALIECRDVWKALGGQQVLNGLTCRFPPGVTVILGPSGAGKTTLLRHLVGAERPDRGAVVVDGVPISEMDEARLLELRRRTGVLFEDWKALFYGLTLYDNVAFPLRHVHSLSEERIRPIVVGLLQELGIAEAAHLYPENLSVGMRTRGGVARALVSNPDVVLLDRPEEGLDEVRAKLLFSWIRDWQRRHDSTFVIISHHVDAALSIADRALVMNEGRVIAQGSQAQRAALVEALLRAGVS